MAGMDLHGWNAWNRSPTAIAALLMESQTRHFTNGRRLSLCPQSRDSGCGIVGSAWKNWRELLIQGGDVLQQVERLDTVVSIKNRHPRLGLHRFQDILPTAPNLTPIVFSSCHHSDAA
jgi:hypothetical protein